MRRIINNRLTNIQCGFRQGHSTVDHLVLLKSHIGDAFLKKKPDLTVFFDLEKAFGTIWQCGILKELSDFGLKCRFLYGFFNDRHFMFAWVLLFQTHTPRR